MLFDINDKCKNIFFVLAGIVDVVIADQNGHSAVLDVCGRGSIFGMSFILM